ncbi:hypothetical protein CMQ_1935 [Grosmannia clavigera kw1407]|uniref:Uncharacterized protein n=1 Tax=Grosmannia clavigera (strain kw1407 / UAMH 11150) TaxID=655863 RepID=F0XNB3_GROCL|nr:uncharacterized protein CMQ_1935 [Grosmannia clavigera kw1407]EFX00854.1 hypothetical protein CMQ_1935 [Grosmannia clavigera kw1407]
MAATAIGHLKGLAADSGVSDSASVNSSASSVKRKRDSTDNGDQVMVDAAAEANGSDVDSNESQSNGGSSRDDTPTAATTSTAGNRDEKRLIYDYFEVLSSFDKSDPPILKRPLPELSASEEPQAKRQKSNGSPSLPLPASIADKVAHDVYVLLDDLVEDLATVVSSEMASLTAAAPKTEADAKLDDSTKAADAAKQRALAQITKFRRKAHELYRRETAYPSSGPLTSNDTASEDGDAILTVFGNTPQPRQLFSSLPHRVPAKRSNAEVYKTDEDDKDSIEEVVREDSELDLGGNIMFTRLFPGQSTAKPGRVLTFGELFPSPRNLPPLQPPKAPKSTTKSTTLGFYHPELEDKSKYRSGSYFSQHITVGQWLDYSNATPSSQIKTKQRERAQSLAGHKPSSSELEMSEMESLFRGAFSSFAPSKDDSAALVPAAQMGHMWWQRVGHRVFQRMVDAEFAVEDDDVTIADGYGVPWMANGASSSPVLDEEALQKTIEEWDDSLVDPSLENVMGQKPDTDKDVNDLLQDVSDLIITLASYQRNRNLTLPTSQDRFSADPVNADMLRNGTLAQQPSEEEMVTYQALKAQLALIIQSLPPYAVARLNSDRLAELNISTKIEVRSEEYRGVMEEDEAVLRARQAAAQAQAAASTPQRAPGHRAGSVSNHGYGQQFSAPSRSPMPATAAFYQTPGRATPQHRQPSLTQGQQFRAAANGYGNYTPTAVKVQQPPFRGPPPGGPLYPGTPGGQAAVPAHLSPQRVAAQPQPGAYGSPAVQTAGAPPQFRYQPGSFGAGGYPQQQQVPAQPVPQPGVPPQQQRLGQQPVGYTPSPANGANHVGQQQQPRPGQVPPPVSSPQPRAQMPYSAGIPSQMTPGQQQLQARAPFGGVPVPMQGMPAGAGQRHFSASAQGGAVPGGPGSGANLGPFGYHTVMDQPQQQRLMEQARARASAHERTLGFADKMSQGGVGPIGGLAGMGPGGNVDMAKLAAARANMPGSAGPRVAQPQQILQQQQQQHGFPQGVPSPSPVTSSVSPAPSGGFQRPS